MSKKTLAEFAWQVTPKRRNLLLALYKESPRRFTVFLVALLRWLDDGAKRDKIEAAAPDTLEPFQRADFENACNEHLDKFRDYHDGADKVHANRTAATPQGTGDNQPTRDEISRICYENERDPKEYGDRVWDEFKSTGFKDRQGKPITNYEAYIAKVLFPQIDRTLTESQFDIDMVSVGTNGACRADGTFACPGIDD